MRPIPGILQARTLEWVAISFSNAWEWTVKVKLLSHVRLFLTPWTAAYQAPPSMGSSRQEHWSGVPLPSPIQNANTNYRLLSKKSGRSTNNVQFICTCRKDNSILLRKFWPVEDAMHQASFTLALILVSYFRIGVSCFVMLCFLSWSEVNQPQADTRPLLLGPPSISSARRSR